jgi:hypothetical protein
MRNFFIIPDSRTGKRFFFAFTIALQCAVAGAIAADNDQEILNQLYREIIGSSPAGIIIKSDSMGTLGKAPSHDREMTQPSDKTADLASERLKKEIDKIVEDAKIRHSDAIKFMQDSK